MLAPTAMKTSVSEIEKNKVRLSVEVPAEDVEQVLGAAYKRLANEVRVPGFRPGKAPRKIIDQRLGKDNVRNEVLREALPNWYAQAVEETELDVVSAPEIDIKRFEDGQDLEFEAVVDTRPTPEVGEYSGLEVAVPPVEVTDEELDEQIGRLRERFSTLEVVERPIDTGDFALIDLTTTHHEETIDEGTTKDFLIEVGAEMVVPELDEELKGKKPGDIIKINTELTERFGERAGLPVSMQALVKEVKARRLPELDDDFATTVSEFDTLEELRSDLRERLAESKEAQAENTVRERVLDAFVEVVDVELSEGMVDLEIDGLVQNFVQMLSSQGMDPEQFLQQQGLDGSELRERFRDQAERNLRLRLGLDAVAAQEGLEATDEDRSERVRELSERSGREPEEVREALQQSGDEASLDGDIIRGKALDLLVERATIVTEDASTTDEEAASSEDDPTSTEGAAASTAEDTAAEEDTATKEDPG